MALHVERGELAAHGPGVDRVEVVAADPPLEPKPPARWVHAIQPPANKCGPPMQRGNRTNEAHSGDRGDGVAVWAHDSCMRVNRTNRSQRTPTLALTLALG